MDLSPLRHRDFRLLYFAQFVSLLGTMITYVALPYQIYPLDRLVAGGRTARPRGAGAAARHRISRRDAGGCRRPAPHGHRHRRRAGARQRRAGAARPYCSADWPLFGVAGWMSAVHGLQRPSIESLTPRLVDRDEFPAAAALASVRGSVSMIAGPALGGVLIASAGLTATYLRRRRVLRRLPGVPLDDPRGAARRRCRSDRACGRCAKASATRASRQELIGTYAVDFVAMVFGMPLALFPALADRLGGPSALGLMYAAPAGGALAASLTSGWTPRVHRHGRAVMVAAPVWGVADRRVRLQRHVVAGTRLPGGRRRRRRGQRHLPHDDVEPDHSGRAAGPSRQHRDGQLLERPAARPRRSRCGSRGVRGPGVRRLRRRPLHRRRAGLQRPAAPVSATTNAG